MLVSIIIPCHNVAPYLQATLDSVSAQTAMFDEDLECLLIDDGSTDATVATCQAYIQDYKGVINYRLLCQPCNRGVSAARNRGIREAKGDYIYFMDGDDLLVPDCIAALCTQVKLHPGVQMVYAGIERTDGDTWMSYQGRNLPAYTEDRHEIKIDIIGCERLTVSCCNKLYLRQLIIDNDLYFDEMLSRQEDDLWNNQLAKCVTRLATIERDTYIYNVHPGSLTTTHDSIECMMNRLVAEERIILLIDEPYRADQIRRALIQEFYYYLNNDNRQVRRRIGQLHRLMAQICPFRQGLVLRALSLMAMLDRGDGSLAFRLYRRFRHHALK